MAQDVILGSYLPFVIDAIRSRPLHVVVLIPRTEVVAARERLRRKDGYGPWTVDLLDDELRHRTTRLGLWLDTSSQSVGETVREILRRGSEAVIET